MSPKVTGGHLSYFAILAEALEEAGPSQVWDILH